MSSKTSLAVVDVEYRVHFPLDSYPSGFMTRTVMVSGRYQAAEPVKLENFHDNLHLLMQKCTEQKACDEDHRPPILEEIWA